MVPDRKPEAKLSGCGLKMNFIQFSSKPSHYDKYYRVSGLLQLLDHIRKNRKILRRFPIRFEDSIYHWGSNDAHISMRILRSKWWIISIRYVCESLRRARWIRHQMYLRPIYPQSPTLCYTLPNSSITILTSYHLVTNLLFPEKKIKWTMLCHIKKLLSCTFISSFSHSDFHLYFLSNRHRRNHDDSTFQFRLRMMMMMMTQKVDWPLIVWHFGPRKIEHVESVRSAQEHDMYGVDSAGEVSWTEDWSPDEIDNVSRLPTTS